MIPASSAPDARLAHAPAETAAWEWRRETAEEMLAGGAQPVSTVAVNRPERPPLVAPALLASPTPMPEGQGA
jgi:hypothetical protein